MTTRNPGDKIITPEFIASYPALFEPKADDRGELFYSVALVFPAGASRGLRAFIRVADLFVPQVGQSLIFLLRPEAADGLPKPTMPAPRSTKIRGTGAATKGTTAKGPMA